MKKMIVVAVLLAASVAAALALAAPGSELAQEARNCFVTNFPKAWNVNGTVGIDGPIKHYKFTAVRDLVVSTVSPKDTVRMIQGGTVEGDGFTDMVLGLQGQIKGQIGRAGAVGVFLLPDEPSIVSAFEEKGLMQFAIEVTAAGVSDKSTYFASPANQSPIGFPRYRTYFYNTTDKSVTVNLYAYLTN